MIFFCCVCIFECLVTIRLPLGEIHSVYKTSEWIFGLAKATRASINIVVIRSWAKCQFWGSYPFKVYGCFHRLCNAKPVVSTSIFLHGPIFKRRTLSSAKATFSPQQWTVPTQRRDLLNSWVALLIRKKRKEPFLVIIQSVQQVKAYLTT